MNLDVAKINLWFWLARRVPKKLTYYCSMVLLGHATSGKYGGTIVPEIPAMEAISRYGKDFSV